MNRAHENGPALAIGGGRFRAPQLALTALLHLGLAWLLFAALGPRAVRPAPAPTYVTLVDVPLPKPAPQAAAVPGPERAAPPRPARKIPRPRTARAVAPVSAIDAPAAAPADAAPVSTQAAPAEPRPVFNREAALAAARGMTHLPDPAREGTAVAQFDARRELEETEQDKLGRKIASAKRRDCISAAGGGSLLTPLMWLLDKKGSGCKF